MSALKIRQVILALLKSDQRGFSSAINLLKPREIPGLLAELCQSRLALLFFEHLTAFNRESPTQVVTEMLTTMRSAAFQKSHLAEGVDDQLGQLLPVLGSFGNDVLLYKGVALSRTIYRNFQHRVSQDIDIIVNPRRTEEIIESLASHGYHPLWNVPGHSPQFGVGPVGSPSLLGIVPSSELAAFHNITLEKEGGVHIELKGDPLDTCIKMRTQDRLFAEAKKLEWRGEAIWYPPNYIHLVLLLTHFQKHNYAGFAWLYDVHLLCGQLSQSEWKDFLTICSQEEVESSAFHGLQECRESLCTVIPESVFEHLSRRRGVFSNHWLVKNVTAKYEWNVQSLVDQLLSIMVHSDYQRKLKIMKDSFVPSNAFLTGYYRGIPLLFARFLHLLVLVLPGSMVRRTIGLLVASWKFPPRKAAPELTTTTGSSENLV